MTHYESNEHMRTSIRVRGLSQAHDSGKAIVFQANTKFFWQKTAAKNEQESGAIAKTTARCALYIAALKIFVFIKRKKTKFIPSSKMKCPKSGYFY